MAADNGAKGVRSVATESIRLNDILTRVQRDVAQTLRNEQAKEVVRPLKGGPAEQSKPSGDKSAVEPDSQQQREVQISGPAGGSNSPVNPPVKSKI